MLFTVTSLNSHGFWETTRHTLRAIGWEVQARQRAGHTAIDVQPYTPEPMPPDAMTLPAKPKPAQRSARQ